MKIISATNPRWADDAQTIISLDVEFEGLGVLPFSAQSNDTEAYGRALFAQAVAGDFGAISPKPPKPLSEVKAAKLAALEASRKAIETTPITGNQGGKLFNISRPEKVNEFLMGGVQIALDSSPAASFSMLDDNGVEVSYTKALMGQIISFMNTAKQPALARYAARKAAIEAASSAAAVDAVEVDLSKP